MYDPRVKGYRKRRRSLIVANQAHELTFSCYHGYPLLNKDRSCRWLIHAIDRARWIHEFDLLGYVIMPEHIHLLIRPRSKNYSVAAILKSIKQPTARRALAWLRRHRSDWLQKLVGCGAANRTRHHFWQPGGGYDRNVIDPDAIRAMLEYLHANPVRRGLVHVPTEWYWSSAQWYAGVRDGPITIDSESDVWH